MANPDPRVDPSLRRIIDPALLRSRAGECPSCGYLLALQSGVRACGAEQDGFYCTRAAGRHELHVAVFTDPLGAPGHEAHFVCVAWSYKGIYRG